MNKYKEIKTLGKGSFGRAVLVQEISTGNKYVIKIIQVSAMKPNEREEAVQEAKILERLQHPNITGYKESFTDNKFLYIVMEYANGGDLHDLIKKQKMQGRLFDEETIWNYFLQVCLAVKHIHDRRILHRDLKTQNIFISLDPHTGQKMMKIGDFGVSKVLSSTMECARTAIGTPYYLSPELCNNQGYNNKSDIWALGCILYELCTLNHTFEAANMKMLVVKILEGRYQEISPKYSKQLKDVVAMMLKKDPKARPNINTLLKQPFIVNKIKQQLTYIEQTVLEDEFSHTMFHGKGNLLKGFTQVSSRPSSAAQNPFSQNKGKEAETPDTRSKDSASNIVHGGFSNYPSAKKQPTPPRDAVMGFRNYPSHVPAAASAAAPPPTKPAGAPANVHPISQAQQNQILAQAKQKQELIKQERQKAEQLIINQAKAVSKPAYPTNIAKRPGSGMYQPTGVKPNVNNNQKPGDVVQGFCKYPSNTNNAQQPSQQVPSYPKNVQESKPKVESHVPSAETLAGKFADLDNIYSAQAAGCQAAQPFQAPVNVQSTASNQPQQQMPFQAPAPTPGAIGGMFAYNPPNIQAPEESNDQCGAAQRAHQAEVRRQLAPMSDKDKVRYQREKELQERRQKAQQLQKEHQEKLAAQQRQRQEKYMQLNKKYEQDMAARREKAAKEEEKLQNEEAAKKQQRQEEAQKQQQLQKERDVQMQQKVEELRRKNEVELAKRREFIAKKKEEAKNQAAGNGNGDFKVEIAGAAPEGIEMTPVNAETPAIVQNNNSNKEEEEPQINPVDNQEESSDFGDQPDQAMAEANNKDFKQEDDAAKWQRRLKDPNSSESLGYRIESLRCYMEKEIGLDRFVQVYNALSDAAAEDKEDYDHDIVNKALGDERMGMLNVIVQLILVEQQLNQQT